MYTEYHDTYDTLRNTLTVKVSEQVDMVEIWGWRKPNGKRARMIS